MNFNFLKIQQLLNKLGYNLVEDGLSGIKTTNAIKDFQKKNGLIVDGIIGTKTLEKLQDLTNTVNNNYVIISQKTINMIINFEVTSPSYYEKKYSHPTFPALQSGITIGIGYDLGYNTKEQIISDWKNEISDNDLNRLITCAGLKGNSAKLKLNSVLDIYIPYNIAYKIFVEKTLPRFVKNAINTYPNLKNLNPDTIGAIVSLVFNRGTALTPSSTRQEMADLKPLIQNSNYQEIGNTIIKMKRLWDGIKDNGEIGRATGLIERRNSEGTLVKNSIRQYSQDELVKIYY